MNGRGDTLESSHGRAEIVGNMFDWVEACIRRLPAERKAELFGRSLLSDRAILRSIEQGRITIDPFRRENLGTTSYDVSLGEWYYRECESDLRSAPVLHGQDRITGIFNPYDEEHVRRVLGEPQRAKTLAESEFKVIGTLRGLRPEDGIIWIFPHETILCHTEEFIGGRPPIVTTMMKARSSVGRVFIEVCKCAGWGDVGYVNRWTMEFTNNSEQYTIPLVVGRRVGQIAFFEVEPILENDYTTSGKYQSSSDLEELKRLWKPEMMLPRLYRDREAVEAATGTGG